MTPLQSLRLALDAERHCHQKDNEYFLTEIAQLRTLLNQALGVIVEFGDLNGFRNTTNEELGKLVKVLAEKIASALNIP